jgi:hypothetical protein
MAACTGNATPSAGGTPTTAPTVGSSASAPSGGSGDPCTLLTAADVQSALGEKVTNSTGSTGATAADGSNVKQCVLSTDGPAPMGGGAQSILGFVAGLAGQQPNINLTTGGIAVLVTTTATPVTASATGLPVPSGGSAAGGIGKSAYAVPAPTGGGIAVSQVDDTTSVIVVDLEGKQVTADQLTALLKAAVARV